MSRRKLSIAVSLIACFVISPIRAHAQTPGNSENLPEFEVASVKPNNSGLPSGNLNGTDSTRFSARNITLNLLIRLAWQVREYQILGGPAWVNSDRFDITAKTDTDVDNDQMMLMLRKLLENRFGLVLRRETKELPIYALVAAKGGLKLQAGQCVDVNGPVSSPGALACGRIRIFKNGLDGQTSMPLFVNILSDMLARPVTDGTGFTGPFDVRLLWAPDDSTPGDRSGDSLPSTDGTDPSFFTALVEQLGLRLESRNGPLETITVEHAEKPTGN